MRQISLIYSSKEELLCFLNKHKLSEQQGIVQLFSGISPHRTTAIQSLLKTQLSDFTLIGLSTAGKIQNGNYLTQKLVIHFFIFETEVKTIPFYYSKSTTNSIETLLDHQSASPRFLICFGNSLSDDSEKLIHEIKIMFPNCKISGGLAATNVAFNGSFVLLENSIYRSGLVGIALYGEKLHSVVKSQILSNPIGKSFTVTESFQNILYSVDHQPILDIYRRYLGDKILDGFPNTVMEFPFLVKRGKQQFLRAPLGLCKDRRGVIFAGNLELGDSLYFSFADLTEFERKTNKCIQPYKGVSLLYYCSDKMKFIDEQADSETQKNDYTCFLTGEFFKENSCFALHNLSTTLLLLSESDDHQIVQSSKPIDTTVTPSTLQTLSFLAKTAYSELSETMKFLEQQQYAVNFGSIVSMTDSKGVITYVNKNFEEISGYKSNQLVGQTHRLVKNPAMSAKVYKSLWETITKKKPWQGLMLNKRKDGSSYYVKTVVVPLLDDQQEITHYLSIRQDITDIIKARQTIKIHTTDLLTGLHNRTKLTADLKKRQLPALAMFDVRNFKLLNDVWGIEHGDEIIKVLAQYLLKYSESMKLVPYRLNGATFALMPAVNLSIDNFIFRCEKLKESLEAQMIKVNSHEFDVNFNIGIGISATHALALAEVALIDSKKSFATTPIIKTDSDLTCNKTYLCIEEVRKALEENRLTAVFQKIALVKDNFQHNKKFEALVRISKENGVLISPGEFLEQIKKTRLYSYLTRTIVTISFSAVKSHNINVSINLSIQDILDEDTKKFIFNKLYEHGGENIIFEITESEAIQDYSNVSEFINKVRGFGAKIAIDDFGSGYSNFAYLVDLNPDYIKIDGSIVKGVVENENSRLVTKSIIEMAHSLNIKVIAEFVSNDAIYNCLVNLEVDMVQGFHIGKPLPLEQLDFKNI